MVEKAEMLQFTRPLYYIKLACRMLYFSYIQTSISSIVVKFHIIKYALRHSTPQLPILLELSLFAF